MEETGSGKTTWRRWPLWGDLSGERRLPSSGKDETTAGSKLAAGCRLCPKKTHFTERETKTQRTQVTSPELRSARGRLRTQIPGSRADAQNHQACCLWKIPRSTVLPHSSPQPVAPN